MGPITIIGLLALAAIAAVLSLVKTVARLALWIKRRGDRGPYHRGLWRATAGSFLLALCIYAATWVPVGAIAAAFWRAPADHAGVAVFAAAAVLGLLWLVTGIRGARAGGDRDSMGAVWSAAVAGGCFCLLHWQWYLPPDWGLPGALGNVGIKALYIAAIAAAVVRAWLCAPFGGSARRMVNRQLRRNSAVMVAATGRRFRAGPWVAFGALALLGFGAFCFLW